MVLSGKRAVAAASWMRECGDLCEKLTQGRVAQLDRQLRLCLTREGPIYFIKGKESRSGYRRCGYTYYTCGFAEDLYSAAIRPDIKGGHEL